jgi:hypothetical protein
MAFLRGLEDLYLIDWGSTHLWDIKFLGNKRPPAPFNAWFPATDISDPRSSLESADFVTATTSFKLPSKRNQYVMNLAFVDDINGTLEKWFRSWIDNDILNLGGDWVMNPLNQITREVAIRRQGTTGLTDLLQFQGIFSRANIDEERYLVYPEGEITFVGNSDGGARIFTLDFVKVGGNLYAV